MIDNTRKESINVAFLIGSMSGGGIERLVLNMLRSVDRSRLNCTVLVLKKEGEYMDSYTEHVDVYEIAGTSLLNKAKSLKGLIQEHKFDVILSYSRPSNYLVLITRIVYGLKKIKVIINEQNNLSAKLDIRYSKAKRAFVTRMTPILYKRANLIITGSKGIKRDLVENFSVNPESIFPMHNAIDLKVIEDKRHKDIEGEFKKASLNLVAVGRLTKQKAFDQLILAIEKIRDLDVHLKIVGMGPDLDALSSLIESKGLSEKIELVGFKNNPWAYMQKSDVFVLSSIFEGFGNVVVEAMACECAIVSTDCDFGPGEIVNDGEFGLLVPINKPDEMAEKIRHLYNNPKEIKNLASLAYKRSKDFDSLETGRKFETLLFDIVYKK